MALGLSLWVYAVWNTVNFVCMIGMCIWVKENFKKRKKKVVHLIVCLIVVSVVASLIGLAGDENRLSEEEKKEGIVIVEKRMQELQEKGSVGAGEMEFNLEGYAQGNVGEMDVIVGTEKYHVKVDKKKKKVIEVDKVGEVVQ